MPNPTAKPPTQPPFTRLPTTPVQSDLYDKLSSVGQKASQDTAALTTEQQAMKASQDTLQADLGKVQKQLSTPGGLVVSLRNALESTFLTNSDCAVKFTAASGTVKCMLPPKAAVGQIFIIKNSGAATVEMDAPNGQVIEGNPANTYSLATGECLILQCDDFGSYILIGQV